MAKIVAHDDSTGIPLNSMPLEPVDVRTFPARADQLDLFLLMGQSNMKGRGIVPPVQIVNRRIIMLHMKNDRWYFARHPLHLVGEPDTLDGSDNAGVGPGMSFAETALARQPDHVVGLIPSAVGGSSINYWKGRGAKFYDETIRRVRLVDASLSDRAHIRAVLWMQGESDAVEERYRAYGSALLAMIKQLRSDLKNERLPFITTTIREFSPTDKLAERFPRTREINATLLNLEAASPNNACVDIRDITGHIGDGLHYDTPAQITIGRRLAEKYLSLRPNTISSEAGPASSVLPFSDQ